LITGYPDAAGAPTVIGADALHFSLFNGSIDEVQIYNRTLSSQQIASLYAAGIGNYNTIVSQETNVNDTWQACLTPNDRTQDGATKCSNNVTVGPQVYSDCPGNMQTGVWTLTADYNTSTNITLRFGLLARVILVLIQ